MLELYVKYINNRGHPSKLGSSESQDYTELELDGYVS